MPKVGTEANAMRVAIIGSGPAGFYTVSHFLKQKGLAVELDIYDRLPSPFGLVRAGVAPDHQKDKSVIRAYGKSAENPNFLGMLNTDPILCSKILESIIIR